MSGQSTSVIFPTHCINRAILLAGSDYGDHISEEVPHSLDGLVKINVDHTVNRPSPKMPLPVQFKSYVIYVYKVYHRGK
jgi:hypothetical protein